MGEGACVLCCAHLVCDVVVYVARDVAGDAFHLEHGGRPRQQVARVWTGGGAGEAGGGRGQLGRQPPWQGRGSAAAGRARAAALVRFRAQQKACVQHGGAAAVNFWAHRLRAPGWDYLGREPVRARASLGAQAEKAVPDHAARNLLLHMGSV